MPTARTASNQNALVPWPARFEKKFCLSNSLAESTIARRMRQRLSVIFAVLICARLLGASGKRARFKPSPSPRPLAWAYVGGGGVRLLKKPGDSKAVTGHLGRGELAEALERKTRGGIIWVRVMARDPATLQERVGWVKARTIEEMPPDRFPNDRACLDAMGGQYLDDTVAAQAVMVRYLARPARGGILLVAWVGSPLLAHVRLQLFRQSGGKWLAGPFLEFPYAGMKTAMEDMQIRNLRGSEGECLISTEEAPSELGATLRQFVIRRVSARGFHTLWRAPLELANFTSYPAQIHALSPAVKNIGAPGTKTQGNVVFIARQGAWVPRWKGRVNFYVVGRSAPVQSVTIEKVCLWNGARFEPLQ